ncbi:MAG: hypothetical protein AAGF11_34020, partial [Myxococcota bacterium]
MNRLQRYRELMRTLDPSGDPRQALRNGWGVERPDSSTTNRIARRIELEPWSQHLLVGGIGSGKTTELWRVHQQLREIGNDSGDATFYIDVAARTRLADLAPGVLAALAGQQLTQFEAQLRRARGQEQQLPEVTRAIDQIRRIADGYSFWIPEDDVGDEPDDYDEPRGYHETVSGVITSPEPPIKHDVARLIPHLRVLKNAVTAEDGYCILLFDSLDRVNSTEQLASVLHNDIRALQEAEIGVVVVGPMRLHYGAHPTLVDLFAQNLHTLAEVEPVDSGLEFLADVLSRRTTPEIMPEQPRLELARASGGVLRDLIALAKSSAQEAYGSGSDRVEVEHVARAAEQFGRIRAVGLDGEQIEVLKKIRKSGTLVIRGERE